MIGDRAFAARRSGFSLVELLVVVALFSTAAIILSQIFVSFNRLHRKVSTLAILSQDMRFVTELFVRESRNASINYPAYPDAATIASSTSLHLIKGPTDITDIQVRTAECGDLPSVRCLALSKDGGATWAPVTAKRVNVKFFGVYVRPTKSPFDQVGGVYLSNTQPFVTMNLEMEYIADNPKDTASLQAQTTVSSRAYQR